MAQVPATRGQGGNLTARRDNPLERLHRNFDSVFARLWNGLLSPSAEEFGSMRLWDFDVTENEKEIVVRAELPGFEENELDVQLNGDVLTIRAEKEQRDDQLEEYRSFYRSITLPPGINAENVQAIHRNGVLELHIPRAEGAQPKRINIQGEGNGARGSEQGQPKSGEVSDAEASAGDKANQGQSAKQPRAKAPEKKD